MLKKFTLLVIICIVGVVSVSKGQYCLPTYSNFCTSNDYIDNFYTTGGLTNISNLASGCNGSAPNNYTYDSISVVSQLPGLGVVLNMQAGSSFGQQFGVWVDWNQDGDFLDTDEFVYFTASSTTALNTSPSIMVPVTANLGNTRMRVLCKYAGVSLIQTDVCNAYTFGECEDYVFNVVTPVPCAGMPTAGTVVPASVTKCAGQTATIGVTGMSIAGGQSYQWQQSANGGTTWTNVIGGTGGATNMYYTPTLTSTMLYRLIVTCIASNQSDTSTISTINVTPPQYAPIPYSQGFETWGNYCGTNDIPLGTSINWTNNPATGNESWRREDDGNSALWNSATIMGYYPASSQGSHSARFHSYYTSNTGNLDLYLDCSGQLGTKGLFFDYICDNVASGGTDFLSVEVSTNGGATFSNIGTYTNSAKWQTVALNLNSNSATTVLRFSATGDFSFWTGSDIGIDNISVVPPCSGTPNVGAIDSLLACAGTPFTLTLTGNSSAGNILYTWDSSSSASGPWTTVNTTIPPFVNVAISTPTYFRCIATCYNGFPFLSDTSAPQLINMNTFYNCYCNGSQSSVGTYQNIGNVTLNKGTTPVFSNGLATPGISSTQPMNLYTSFATAISPIPFIFKDSVYTITDSTISQNTWGFSNGYTHIYIDYNRDGIFDPALELVGAGSHNSTTGAYTTLPFTVPNTAQFGITGLRVVYEVFGSLSSVGPCDPYFDGETEDYLVEIAIPPCIVPPNAGTAYIDDTLTCPGYSVFLTDTTHDVFYNGLAHIWQMSNDGINFTDIAGATNDTLTYIVSANTWFRFKTSCFTNSVSYSNVVKVTMSNPLACYGASQATGGGLDTCDIGAFIVADYFTNNNLYLYTVGGPHLSNLLATRKRTDYTNSTIMNLYADSTYKLSVYSILKGNVHQDARVTIFMDYNNNQVYDIPQERVFTGIADINNFYLSGNIHTIANPALNVNTGLRVILNNEVNPNPASDNGVGAYTSGETEDFLVKFISKPLEINNANFIQDIGVYPNPTSNKVYIGFNATESLDATISILNITGSTLISKNFTNIHNDFVTEFDLGNFAKGTYLIKIDSEKGKFVRRVVVE